MKKNIAALILAALLLCGCMKTSQQGQDASAFTAEPTKAATVEPTEGAATQPTKPIPTVEPDAVDPEIVDAAWAFAEKIEQAHEQQFDKAGAKVQVIAYSTMVCFPSVTYPDEALFVMVEKDDKGNYSACAEGTYTEPAEGAGDGLNERFDLNTVSEKTEEFRNAVINVTAEEIGASGCEAEIGSSDYKAAAAAICGEKLAEYYRGSLTEDSPFYCYDVRFVRSEFEPNYQGTYVVQLGFRVRDMLLFSYLFGNGLIYDNGSFDPDYEGWLIGYTLVHVKLDDDGSFTTNAILNFAG